MAAEQGHLFIGRNDDTTTAARTQGWDIFSPSWDFVSQHPVLPLISLVALSVGLHPYFADPAWVFSVAMPYFSGEERDECCPLDDHELGLRRCEALSEFLSRALSAPENIVP